MNINLLVLADSAGAVGHLLNPTHGRVGFKKVFEN